MLKIIACFKWVVDEADIKVDAASRKLLFDRAGYKISAYDRNAVEEAVRLQERYGGSVAALTAALPTAKACLKDVLSRGPDKAYFINDPSLNDPEPAQTTALLAAAIKGGIEYDLIICGEGSSDLYTQYVGPALAERLGIPCATYVNKLTYVEGENRVEAQRKLDDGLETLSLPLPALVTVLPDINTPRIPTLKQVLGAAKKPVEHIAAGVLGPLEAPRLRTTEVRAATMDRKRRKFGAESDDIRSVVAALLKEGVIA